MKFWISLIWLIALQPNEFIVQRQIMIEDQIKARGISDPATIQAMEKVERHLFVPPEQERRAYADGPLPIGFGQTISQPYIVAYMTETLKLTQNDVVLEIGTGSGYQAAVLSEIVDQVYTIEIIPELYKASSARLKALGYHNIHVINSDGYHGHPDKAPYDAIMVTAAAEFVPPPLIQQLKEGGKMIIPVGTPFGTQRLMLLEKKEGKVKSRNLLYVRFVPFTRSED